MGGIVSSIFGGGSSGGGGSAQTSSQQPTNQNITTSNIAPWAQPGVTNLINAGMGQVFESNPDGSINFNQMKGYTPFDASTAAGQEWVQGAQGSVAGLSPLQQQAAASLANMQTPSQYGLGMDFATQAGMGSLGTTGQAAGYGAMGANYGAQAAGLSPQAQMYGANAANIGTTGGMGYGAMGANAGQAAANMGAYGGALYGQQGSQAGQAAGQIGTQAGLGYGAQGSQAGQQATQYGALGAQQGLSYGQNAQNPGAVQSYMNPYLQATLAPALALQEQEFGMKNMQNQAQATQQGAFGGGRSAVMQGLNQQNQALAQNQLVANAYNQAYNTANQNMQQASQLGMQGAGMGITGQNAAISGANAGLAGANTALQGQQTNISGANTGLAGVNAGLAGQNAAMQGAGLGITGTNAAVNAQQAGLSGLGQAGSLLSQGMQGSQVGLQGVGAQQAGYAGLGSQGTNLANIAGAETQTGLNIAAAQQAAGATEQQNRQNVLNQAMANYNTAQTQPMTQLAQLESLYTGAPQNITSSTYSAAPSTTSQLAGLAGTAIAGAKLAGKKGGLPKDFEVKKMAKGGITGGAIGNVEASLENMDASGLENTIKTSTSPFIREKAKELLVEAMQRGAGVTGARSGKSYAAGGGIVAFADGGYAFSPEEMMAGTTRSTPLPPVSAPPSGGLKNVMSYLDQLKGLGYGTATEEEKASRDEIKSERATLKADRDRNKWLALLEGSGAALSSTSPFANPGIGAMISTGAKAYAGHEKDYADQLAKLRSGDIDLNKLSSTDRNNLLHYAMTGATSEENTKMRTAEMLEAAKLRNSQIGGQNADREQLKLLSIAKDFYTADLKAAQDKLGIDKVTEEMKQTIYNNAMRRASQVPNMLKQGDKGGGANVGAKDAGTDPLNIRG